MMRAIYIAHKDDGTAWIYIPERRMFFTALANGVKALLTVSYYAFHFLDPETDTIALKEYINEHYDVVKEMDVPDRIVNFICERDYRRREINYYSYEQTRDPKLACLPERRTALVEDRRAELREWCEKNGERELNVEIEKLIVSPRGLH